MGSSTSPRNRGVNVDVKFDLGCFTTKLFTALGAGVRFDGPGPCSVSWLSSTASTTERFAVDYLANELFSKFDDGKPSAEKRTKAVQRFMEGEILCSLTNCKFSPLPSGQVPAWLETDSMLAEGYSREDSHVFRRAQGIISKILGAFPGWENVLQYADFGPGSTTRLPRRDSHRSNKWSGRPHATSTVSSVIEGLFEAVPLLMSRLDDPGFEIEPGNKLDWVPKNYKTERTIAIEPDWNMFLQKGIGTLIRRRLKRVKQDLDDQSTNRFLAALGSIKGDLATLDMSMASDTVAYRLVEYLIRPDWFEALKQCRSHVGFYTLGEGSSKVTNAVIFEKFSSMGNGYTFELESLIFYGLLRAVSELSEESDHRLYVYGDDIVVPTAMAEIAMTYLRKAGFMVNPDKSFVEGPFRESCGGHYFNGADVTPFYVREAVDKLDRLFLLHNNVYRWFNRFPGIISPEDARDILAWIRHHAPPAWRKPRLLSEDVGDGAFIGSFDEVCPRPIGKKSRYRGWEGWAAITLQFRPKLRTVTVRGEESRLKRYPAKAGPDLASLWGLEKRQVDETPTFDQFYKHRPKILDWLRGLSLVDIDNWYLQGTVAPLPRQEEREWFQATQVLPYKYGGSWW